MIKRVVSVLLWVLALFQLSAQSQSWQWVKAGGSQFAGHLINTAPICKIGGCDARGNVYAMGELIGSNMRFDTFNIPGTVRSDYYRSYLLFSYDCSGNMRWAKRINDFEGLPQSSPGVRTDPYGNTYFTGRFKLGGGTVLQVGDTSLTATGAATYYIYIVKFDSTGHQVWINNIIDPAMFSNNTFSYGIRIGSSGNLWIACHFTDTVFVYKSNTYSVTPGDNQLEIDPATGNLLSGYFTANNFFSLDTRYPDDHYDLDNMENYYETGLLHQSNPPSRLTTDTLKLAHGILFPDSSITLTQPYLYSLDKNGNFRFLVSNRAENVYGNLGTCKFDFGNNQLITTLCIDTMAVYGSDTLRFNSRSVNSMQSQGLISIDTSGQVLWANYITQASGDLRSSFLNTPLPNYIDNVCAHCTLIYNSGDTILNDSLPVNYQRNLIETDFLGHLMTSYTANLGRIDTLRGFYDRIRSGASDWRGNHYFGGSISKYMVTSADSAATTNTVLGDFFIAKIGTSDCSCPTPGTGFTQTAHGDTVHFSGYASNLLDSINWNLGDGTIVTAFSLTHVYANDGTYTVTAVGYNGCGTDSITIQVTFTIAGIKAVGRQTTVLYPNPASSRVFIDISGPAKIGFVAANGAALWAQPMQVAQAGTYVFDMSKYSSALYYFIVEYSNGKVDVMKALKD
jgi:hypothetical protein